MMFRGQGIASWQGSESHICPAATPCWPHERVSGTREKAYSETSLRGAHMRTWRRDSREVFAALTAGRAVARGSAWRSVSPP